MSVYPGGLTEKICPMCKRRFSIYLSCGWAYTKNDKRFCSWKCLRQYEKMRQFPNEKKEQVRELYHKGVPQNKIAKTLFMSVQSVNYWVTKIKDEEMTL